MVGSVIKNVKYRHFKILYAKRISSFNFCPKQLKFALDNYSIQEDIDEEVFWNILEINHFLSLFQEKWPENVYFEQFEVMSEYNRT